MHHDLPHAAPRALRPRATATLTLLLALAVLGGVARPLLAQPAPGEPTRIAPREDLAFDRPESWGMAYFGSVLLTTGFGPAEALDPGAVELGLEGGWVPRLSDQERRIGFIGSKEEDVNRTDAIGRLRATVGLPGALTLTAGYVPPVEVDGVTPHALALALARPIAGDFAGDGERGWSLGLRASVQTATLSGDITCSAATVAAGDDPDVNPLDCLEPSDDEMTLNMASLELSGALHPRSWPALSPYLGLAAHWLDAEFQVRARYGTIEDHTVLTTDDLTWSATAGAGLDLTPRTTLAAELFYTPLDVLRDPTRGQQTDPLLNARILLTHRIR